MPTTGRVMVRDRSYDVVGSSWMDREWSTSSLDAGVVGWDWFALQLDDGWEMMVYQLRLSDGTPDPLSDGVLIDPENSPRLDVRFEMIEPGTSARTRIATEPVAIGAGGVMRTALRGFAGPKLPEALAETGAALEQTINRG